MQTQMHNPTRATGFIWLIMLLLLAYALPWVANPGAALTVNAYDLAEWTTLHPGSINQTPVLLASFTLRVQLLIIAALIALYAPRPRFTGRWWLHASAVILLIIAQLPPLEAITAFDNLNYRQQTLLAMATAIVAIIGLTSWLHRYRPAITIALGLVGISTAIYGIARSIELMQAFQLPAMLHTGAVIFIAGYGILLALTLRQQIQQHQNTA